MTDLANRFEFQRRLSKAFTRAIHLEQPAAVLAIDLDSFKAVDDTAGHAAGDTVLRRVAEVLQTIVRQSDVVARLGGDEFAVILPNCPEASSLVVAQKILGALNPLRVEWQGSTHTIGASLGLAMLQAECQGEADWFEAADQACYQAKKEGRGQLRIARSSEPAANIPEKAKQA
ncbi:MAG: GGDEF domain-containing protein [Pseudomonadota bacterium]|nr:GGDEF domain-containing protein [Pseudomonadota bacterium]